MRFHPRSRHLAAPLFGAALALVSFMPAAPGLVPVETQEDSAAMETGKAAKLYTTSCIGCHLPPDPNIMTDRAWLSQVSDTA